jgi:hypothetical protein
MSKLKLNLGLLILRYRFSKGLVENKLYNFMDYIIN